jgi:hypothetical protein
MIWRCIIRGMGIALLTLCVTAWVGSYIGYFSVCYGRKPHYWSASPAGGSLSLGDFYGGRGPGGFNGWYATYYGRYDAQARLRDQRFYDATPYHLLGFAWQPRILPDDLQFVMIPLWFPTLLSALVLWLVWCKTRSKDSGKGFPVEVTKAEARKA